MNTVEATDLDGHTFVTYCTSCERLAIWIEDFRLVMPDVEDVADKIKNGESALPERQPVKRLVYPAKSSAPPPNDDLPPDIREDYEEATRVLPYSARAAAALLRLCVQKLCKHFGEPGRNIDTDIASLVQKQLIRPALQQAMDVVRVVGNEAVHPGTLDVRDDPDLAHALFKLVNLIAEQAITEPREIDEAFGKLPSSKVEAIAKRDGIPSASSPMPTRS